jgi:hypothetical protein
MSNTDPAGAGFLLLFELFGSYVAWKPGRRTGADAAVNSRLRSAS